MVTVKVHWLLVLRTKPSQVSLRVYSALLMRRHMFRLGLFGFLVEKAQYSAVELLNVGTLFW